MATQPAGRGSHIFPSFKSSNFGIRYLHYAGRTIRITIRDLYPHMSEADLSVAEANLKRYVALIVREFMTRLNSEGKCWPDPPANLTVSEMHRTIPGERSNSPKERN